MKTPIQSIKILTSAIAILAAGTLATFANNEENPKTRSREIVVEGTGKVLAPSDFATVNLAVVTHNLSVKEAMRQNAEIMVVVREKLVEAGFEEKEISTANFNISRDVSYRGEFPKYGDFRVRNSICVNVRDMARVGEAIDIAAQAGANEFSHISFELKNDAEAMSAARIAAVKNARVIAEEMAAAAGTSVGKIISIYDSRVSKMSPTMPRAAVYSAKMISDENAAAGTPISAGKQEISASVTCVFELE